ncbi:MAG: hypothetical protein QM504_03775 [Pseudomonadota bacterium]
MNIPEILTNIAFASGILFLILMWLEKFKSKNNIKYNLEKSKKYLITYANEVKNPNEVKK